MISIIKEEVEEALNILNLIKDDFRTVKDLHTGKPMLSTPAVCSYYHDYGKSFQIALSVLQAYVEGRLVEPMSREEIVSKLMVIDKYIGVSSFPKENYEIIADALSGKISAPILIDKNKLQEVIKYQIEGRGGKINPKDNFQGFILDIEGCIFAQRDE